MALLLSACDTPELAPNAAGEASIARGRAAAAKLGCGACHAMPGIDWPRGRVGPSLNGFADRGLIAGKLPNRLDILARFVRDAPALVPGTGMPAITMSDDDASDLAAWLSSLDAR
ncbi:MAG: c-type cytochrome [Pseudomonadota bacterium]